MTANNDPNPETPLFSAVMIPHRSLERRGYVVQVHRIGLLHWCVRYRAV